MRLRINWVLALCSFVILGSTAMAQPAPGDRFQQLRDRIQERRDKKNESVQQQEGTPQLQQSQQLKQFQQNRTFKRGGLNQESGQQQSGQTQEQGGQSNQNLRKFNVDQLRNRTLPKSGQTEESGQAGQSVTGGLSDRLQKRKLGTDQEAQDAVKSRLEKLKGLQGNKSLGTGAGEQSSGEAAQGQSGQKLNLEQLRKQRLEGLKGKLQGTPASEESAQGESSQKSRLEELKKQRLEGLKGKLQGTPASEESAQGETSQKSKLEELKKQRLEGLKGKLQGTPASGESAQGESGQKSKLEELKKQRLENLKGKLQGTPASGESAQGEGSQKSKLEELKKQRLEGLKGKLEGTPGASGLAGKKFDLNALKAQRFADKTGKLNPLQSIEASKKATLVGANVQPAVDKLGIRNMLSKKDVENRFGDFKVKPRVDLSQNDLRLLKDGRLDRLPKGIDRPWGDHGKVRKSIINIDHVDNLTINNINVNINNFVPPPIHDLRHWDRDHHDHFDWHYWDGHSHYDHGFALNLFIGLGHTTYGGFDGCFVSGRYYSYGFGWIDGCIDYGYHRVWVPGFWSSYAVEECYPSEMWVPPVYEEIWTGCCWETVQVDGGYFVPTGPECHMVTRWAWVPGHYQFVS